MRYAIRKRHRTAENAGIENKYLFVRANFYLYMRKVFVHALYYVYAALVYGMK